MAAVMLSLGDVEQLSTLPAVVDIFFVLPSQFLLGLTNLLQLNLKQTEESVTSNPPLRTQDER